MAANLDWMQAAGKAPGGLSITRPTFSPLSPYLVWVFRARSSNLVFGAGEVFVYFTLGLLVVWFYIIILDSDTVTELHVPALFCILRAAFAGEFCYGACEFSDANFPMRVFRLQSRSVPQLRSVLGFQVRRPIGLMPDACCGLLPFSQLQFSSINSWSGEHAVRETLPPTLSLLYELSLSLANNSRMLALAVLLPFWASACWFYWCHLEGYKNKDYQSIILRCVVAIG